MKSLSEIIDEVAAAGGFGDGIDTGETHPIDILGASPLSKDEQLAASLSLLCRLAGAVDNSAWKDATRSALSRRTREYLDQGGTIAPECAPGVLAFYKSEEGFWTALQDIYQDVVSVRKNG